MAILAKMFTALRGGATEAGEAVVDHQALRILDQEMRDAEKELADRRLWASIWHDDDHARFVFAAYAERSVQPRHAFDRQVAAALAHGNREERLATIVVPTLVLHGTADNLITLGGGQRTAEAIPGADLVVVEGWGHDLAPGAWPQLIEAISTHCHRVDGTD